MKTHRLFCRMDWPKGRWRYVLILWFVLALALFVAGLVFLVFGACYGRGGVWLFATGALSMFVAVPTMAAFFWYVFCAKKSRDTSGRQGQYAYPIGQPTAYDGPLSVIDANRSLSEAELRSDYPMGPLLIMTLPKPRKSNERLANIPSGDSPGSSATSTPDFLAKRHKVLNKNTPPLASEETLSPSLKSSVPSIDDTV